MSNKTLEKQRLREEKHAHIPHIPKYKFSALKTNILNPKWVKNPLFNAIVRGGTRTSDLQFLNPDDFQLKIEKGKGTKAKKSDGKTRLFSRKVT
jgi:hypothetical protein